MAEKSEVIPVDDIANDVEELKKLVEAKVWEKNFKANYYSLKSSSNYIHTGQKKRCFGRKMDSWGRSRMCRSISTCTSYQERQCLGCR